MARCAVYCRVSSDEQAEKGTIEAQIEYAKRYLELHGPEANITDFEFYLDEGVSGTIALPDRPGGSRLVNDAKLNKFDAVYVYRLDRLARSVKHVLDTYDLLESKKIALKSMTEAFDTGTPTGKFFMTLLASIAALERDTILERTQMGKERNAREGKWVSGAPPFGYRIGDDGKLHIYDSEADTVREIFKLYKEGMTTVEIAKYLNAKEKPTPATSKGNKNKSSGKWHAGHISIIIRTEAYAGKYNYLKRSKRKKDTIEINIPEIINEERFALAQQKIIVNGDNARGKRGRLYLLRGLIYCGHCGRAMVGNSGESKSGRVYYRCTGTVDQGQGKRCDTKQLRATDIEKAVWEDIQEIVQHPESFRKYIEQAIRENKQADEPVSNELAEVENSIQAKQNARGKILSMVTRGIISDSEAEIELKNLAAEIKSLIDRKEFLFEKHNRIQSFEADVLTAQTVLDVLSQHMDTLTDEDKARIIKGMVRRIDVFTIIDENGKRGCKAIVEYRLGSGMELVISRDSQTHTTLYSIESTWIFQAFSRNGGFRLRWR